MNSTGSGEERVAADRSNSKGKGLKVRTARALLMENTKGMSSTDQKAGRRLNSRFYTLTQLLEE